MGVSVLSFSIQKFSRLRLASQVLICTFSTAMHLMLCREWLGWLKCFATRLPAFLVMQDLCEVILFLREVLVWPTY